MDISTLGNCLLSSQPLLPDKLLDRLDTKKTSRILNFCPCCTASPYENTEDPSLGLETEFASPSNIYPGGRLIGQS